MSGHSKWHNIQGRKGKQDKLKANQFTKIGRMITLAAREGGGDLTANFALRLAVEKARAVNMPKDNIDRAMKRGTGELNDGVQLEEIVYEGFGPNGVAFLVEAFTDNKNRTAGEIKHAFSSRGGSLGAPGSVQWQFEHKGVVRMSQESVEKIKGKKEQFELVLMDAGVDDISESEYGLEIICPVPQFQKMMEIVQSFDIVPEVSGLEWLPKEMVSLDEGASSKTGELYDILDDMDDVRAVYTNEK